MSCKKCMAWRASNHLVHLLQSHVPDHVCCTRACLQARTFQKLDWRSFQDACMVRLGVYRMRALLLAWADAAALKAWHKHVVAAW